MSERRTAAIKDFGQPSYSYRDMVGSTYTYWFGHMLYMNSANNFSRLKEKRKYIIFGEKALYHYRSDIYNTGWNKCRADVQAKWEAHGVDDLILGVDYGGD